MNELLRIVKLILNSSFSYDELQILCCLDSLWKNEKIEVNSKILLKVCHNFSKSTIHRRLNQLREKQIIDFQVNYNDGRKNNIIPGKDFAKISMQLEKRFKENNYNLI